MLIFEQINVEDTSEVREIKEKEVKDLRTIMKKVEAEKINEEIDMEKKNEIKYRNDSGEKDIGDFKAYEEVDIKRSKKSNIGRNRGLTGDIQDRLNVEQCEVRNFVKEELNVHIRMIHDKGRSMGRENTEEGDDPSPYSGHYAGKQVLGGQHVKNMDSEMKVFVRRMFKWKNKIQWQKLETPGNMIQSLIKSIK